MNQFNQFICKNKQTHHHYLSAKQMYLSGQTHPVTCKQNMSGLTSLLFHHSASDQSTKMHQAKKRNKLKTTKKQNKKPKKPKKPSLTGRCLGTQHSIWDIGFFGVFVFFGFFGFFGLRLLRTYFCFPLPALGIHYFPKKTAFPKIFPAIYFKLLSLKKPKKPKKPMSQIECWVPRHLPVRLGFFGFFMFFRFFCFFRFTVASDIFLKKTLSITGPWYSLFP